MTRSAKIAYALTLVVGLSAGACFGFWKDADIVKSYYSVRRVAAPSEFRDFSLVQYRHADAEHAKAALLAFADFLEKLEALSPDKGHELNLANTYTRLALLEDAAKSPETSRGYMAKAHDWYATSGGQKRSDSEMKAALIGWDKSLEQFPAR